MEITWYGHSCFRLTERSYATVVTDPYDSSVIGYEPLKLKADIVSVSHDAPGHNFVDAVKGTSHEIAGPGEFEIGGVFVTGVLTDVSASAKKKNAGQIRNTLYVFDYEGLSVAHFGDLKQVPTQAEVESLGTVHVALVPVGDGESLNAAKAAELISLIEPYIVIPMHYSTKGAKLKLDPVAKFLKEMGLSAAQEALPSVKITRSGLPDETKIILLDPQVS
jgi:L-ascorbate metabolism protein UlaG (beta-lactamase superfamily)